MTKIDLQFWSPNGLADSYYNKKVSYRKHIACQHSCHENFEPEQRHDQPCKI